MERHTTIAMDIAKNVFEVAVSDEPGRVRERRRLTRSQMMRFFANREPARVVIEACGAAHALARELEPHHGPESACRSTHRPEIRLLSRPLLVRCLRRRARGNHSTKRAGTTRFRLTGGVQIQG